MLSRRRGRYLSGRRARFYDHRDETVSSSIGRKGGNEVEVLLVLSCCQETYGPWDLQCVMHAPKSLILFPKIFRTTRQLRSSDHRYPEREGKIRESLDDGAYSVL